MIQDTVTYSYVADSISTVGMVFGPDSVLHELAGGHMFEAAPLTSGLQYQIPLLLLMIVYCICSFAYGGEVWQVFRLAVGNRKERHMEENQSSFAAILNVLWVSGWIAVGVAMVKVAEVWFSPELLDRVAPYGAVLMIAAVALTGMLMSLAQNIVLRVSGWVTLTGRFISKLLAVRRTTFISFILVEIPLVLIYSLSPVSMAMVLSWVLVGLAALFFMYLLYRTLTLFLEEKVSILLWILYLCAVEAIPYGILVTSILRGI